MGVSWVETPQKAPLRASRRMPLQLFCLCSLWLPRSWPLRGRGRIGGVSEMNGLLRPVIAMQLQLLAWLRIMAKCF